jgi:hypothetical protein
MDPYQYLFDAANQLTGGLITDIKSLFLGGIVIVFVLMGLDYLKDAFEHMLDARAHGRYLEDAKQLRWEMDQYERGSAEWDEANYAYRQTIGNAAKSRLRSWK